MNMVVGLVVECVARGLAKIVMTPVAAHKRISARLSKSIVASKLGRRR